MGVSEASENKDAPEAFNHDESVARVSIAIGEAIEFGPLPDREVSEAAFHELRHHFKSGELKRQKAAIFKSIGGFLQACTHADGMLTAAVANALNPDDPGRVAKIVGPANTSTRLRYLRDSLPESPHYTSMLDHATTMNNRRNYAAHGSIRTVRDDDADGFEWGTWLLNKDKYMPAARKDLRQWTREARAVTASLRATTAILSSRIVLPETMVEDFGGAVQKDVRREFLRVGGVSHATKQISKNRPIVGVEQCDERILT